MLGCRSTLAAVPPPPCSTSHADVYRDLRRCRHLGSRLRLTRSLRARPSPAPRRTPPPRLGACAPTGVVAAISSARVTSHPPRRHAPDEREKRVSRSEVRKLLAEPSRRPRSGLQSASGRSPRGPPVSLRRSTAALAALGYATASIVCPSPCCHVDGARLRSPADPSDLAVHFLGLGPSSGLPRPQRLPASTSDGPRSAFWPSEASHRDLPTRLGLCFRRRRLPVFDLHAASG